MGACRMSKSSFLQVVKTIENKLLQNIFSAKGCMGITRVPKGPMAKTATMT